MNVSGRKLRRWFSPGARARLLRICESRRFALDTVRRKNDHHKLKLICEAAWNMSYRGFLFVQHEKHGLLLLHCTRKKNKPHHWQLPGGHIDKADFDQGSFVQFAC